MTELQSMPENRCGSCDVTLPPEANYCMQCGEPADAPASESVCIREQMRELMGLESVGNSGGRLLPFSYYGGKYNHLTELLALLPHRMAYVEPFGGSGVVLLNREQADVETYNDLDGGVVNFFRVLREQPESLLYELNTSPYSEEEFDVAVEREGYLTDLERARRFFIVATQAFNGQLDGGNWSYNKAYSSRGVSKKISNYQAKLRRLAPIARRLADVQICNRDAVDCIQTFDCEDAIHYCDPPYPPEARVARDQYKIEMTRQEHRELAEVLRRCDGDVAVSSYESELYDDLFLNHGWDRVALGTKKLSSTEKGEGSERTESLYVNYDVTPSMLDSAGLADD